jgi:hypothetical protein
LQITIAIQFTISSAPTINTAANLATFYQTVGSPSPTQTYTVSGTGLTANVAITPPVNFEISNNGGTNWYTNASPLTLTPSSGTLASTTITVRLNASSANTYSGNIVHTSSGATTMNVAVNGNTTNAPAINSTIIQQWPLTANANDDAGVRSSSLTASTPTMNHLYVSTGITTPSFAAYSSTYGQAFGASSNGDGTWSTAVGGPGGTLTRVHYEQFTVTAAGTSVRVDSILLNAAFYNTSSSTKMAIVYSKSGFTTNDSTDVTGGVDQSGAGVVGSFATPIALANQTGGPTNYYRIALNGATGVTITAGQTLTIRMYFACSSTGTPRYAMLKNVTVKGEALSPFPLNLLSFTGSLMENKVKLSWNTVNEINTREFVIEKSTNGRNYTAISSVAAKNNSSNNYIDIDANPNAGINYYRLRVVNLNSAFSYSKVIVINSKASAAFGIYPNPVKDQAVVSHAKAGTNASITLYTSEGKRLFSQQVEAGSLQTTVDLSGLLNGNYVLRYRNNGTTQAQWVIRE